jgi:lipopolysaccharide biosynthesis glycosyltransferase
MSTKAICLQSSKNYFFQAKHAIESAKKHNPDYKIVLLSDGIESDLVDIHVSIEDLEINRHEINPTTNNFTWLVSGRPAIVRYVLQELNFDSCIFIDGDTYTFNSYEKIQDTLNNGASIVVTPHILQPIPNDGHAPPINDFCLMGNYNSGVFASSKKGIKFVTWWEQQTKLYPYMYKQNGIAAEQGWLRFAGDFDDDTKIFRNVGYNVAYWNIAQRNLNKKNNIYFCGDEKLTIMHFSGLKKETPPENLSVYQNRYKLKKDSVIYDLFSDYKKLVWGLT